MWLIDQLAEEHIRKALAEGELDNLPGAGMPLQIEDDSHVPQELRASYRILKNAGFLPPELQLRREAMELNEFLESCQLENPQYAHYLKRLQVVELTLRQAGMNTEFLYGDYAASLRNRMK